MNNIKLQNESFQIKYPFEFFLSLYSSINRTIVQFETYPHLLENSAYFCQTFKAHFLHNPGLVFSLIPCVF